jgi:hypothetical protein
MRQSVPKQFLGTELKTLGVNLFVASLYNSLVFVEK